MNLLQERELARTEKHWQRADELRDMIAEYGYVIEDTANGPKLSR
jgi:cysteinyl-tRNA synthetase